MKLILINGPSGIGKSTISARLHTEIADSVYVDVDELRRSIPNYREQRKESLFASYEKARVAAAKYLKEGRTVIIDKAVSRPDAMDSLIKVAEECGADVRELLLFAPKETVQARADERGYKPGSLLTRERVGELWEQFDQLRQQRQTAIVIDTSSLTVDETYEKVKAAIA